MTNKKIIPNIILAAVPEGRLIKIEAIKISCMKKIFLLLIPLALLAACTGKISPEKGPHDLVFEELPTVWDEGIPLGNGMLGALVWQKGTRLRISLDRADLWDLRPMAGLDLEKYNYEWVCRQWENNTYEKVQERLDAPYNEEPAPSKIPAGALEFNIDMLGETEYVRLYLDEALCKVKWMNGTSLLIFVDAAGQAGWFSFDSLDHALDPELLPPAYTVDETGGQKNISTETNLTALGYDEGKINRYNDRITYTQEGWGGFEYTVDLKWEKGEDELTGCWSISSEMPGDEEELKAKAMVDRAFKKGMDRAFDDHALWWDEFWNRSAISIPDKLLEKQWYLEMYKFGSAARPSSPPIPLQGLWTADNGMLPPWKGDFHHDLNTQLSYWPAYSSNHLDLEEGFINWLWKYRPVFEKYTGEYYASGGLNVPGVTTLTGEPMGGWIQYSLGPTVSAWLGHHFYLHWRYSMDRAFLEEKAYPWLTDVARHFDDIAVEGAGGKLKLPLSSSPEINDNSRDAWFSETTNFDLALIRWTYSKASEMALALGKNDEARRWQERLDKWPGLAVDEQTGLMIAPGHPYENSHRHFSHLMAWHPLGLVDVNMGEEEKETVTNTLDNLLDRGTGWWTGYSFSWLANLQARALDGAGAAEALEIFAKAFCLPNSFHVNGDQSGKGYSNFTYRPFTLEGNFAFAAGLQEMLVQSHTGAIVLFPAIPGEWKNLSFDKLRTEGAFLVSATMEEGRVKEVEILSLAGADCKIKNPFSEAFDANKKGIRVSSEFIGFETSKNEKVVLKAK